MGVVCQLNDLGLNIMNISAWVYANRIECFSLLNWILSEDGSQSYAVDCIVCGVCVVAEGAVQNAGTS